MAVLKSFIDAAVPIYEAIRDRTSVSGMTARSKKLLEAAAIGAKAAGLADLKVVAAKGPGHLSHAGGTEWDLVGINPDGSKWTTKQRIQVADAARTAGADRFGIYNMEKGTGAGTLHMGYSGPGRPAAVWGAGGRTGGAGAHDFTDPNEKTFLVSYNEGKPLNLLPDNKPTTAMKGGPGAEPKKLPTPQEEFEATYNAPSPAPGPVYPAEPYPEEGSPGGQPNLPPPPQGAGGAAEDSLFSPIEDKRLVDVLDVPPPIPWGDTELGRGLTLDDIFNPVDAPQLDPIPDPIPIEFSLPEIQGIPRLPPQQRLAALRAANQNMGRTLAPDVPVLVPNDIEKIRQRYPGITDAEIQDIIKAVTPQPANQNRR